MKIVLTARVANLGQPWDVKEVKTGYAMNFLFPQQLAVPATKQMLVEAQKRKAERVQKLEDMKANVQTMMDQMKNIVLNFKMKAQGEKLYGSIAEKDIVEAMLTQHKMELEKSMVKMDEHIKTVGEHTVKIHLAEKMDAQVKVVVEAEVE